MNVKYIVQRFGEDIYCKCSPFTIISSVVSVDDVASGEEIPDILNIGLRRLTPGACTASIITKPIPNLH